MHFKSSMPHTFHREKHVQHRRTHSEMTGCWKTKEIKIGVREMSQIQTFQSTYQAANNFYWWSWAYSCKWIWSTLVKCIVRFFFHREAGVNLRDSVQLVYLILTGNAMTCHMLKSSGSRFPEITCQAHNLCVKVHTCTFMLCQTVE